MPRQNEPTHQSEERELAMGGGIPPRIHALRVRRRHNSRTSAPFDMRQDATKEEGKHPVRTNLATSRERANLLWEEGYPLGFTRSERTGAITQEQLQRFTHVKKRREKRKSARSKRAHVPVRKVRAHSSRRDTLSDPRSLRACVL